MSVRVIVLEGQLLRIKIYTPTIWTHAHTHLCAHTHISLPFDNYKTGAPRASPRSVFQRLMEQFVLPFKSDVLCCFV